MAELEAKLPGVILMVVAPVAVQLRALLAPELTVVGLAAKEEIAGAEPCGGTGL